MKDNEIIKAFECCLGGYEEDCKNCPNRTTCGEIDVVESVLDLINRQKEEIEHLKLTTIVGEVREIPLKFEKLACISWEHPLVEAVKAEAIKEFADRLKMKSRKRVSDVYGARVYIQDIDNLVKEMTKEQGNDRLPIDKKNGSRN